MVSGQIINFVVGFDGALGGGLSQMQRRDGFKSGDLPALEIRFCASWLEFKLTSASFANSELADYALIVAAIASVLGLCITAKASLMSLFQFTAAGLFNGLVLGPIAFFVQLGMLVVIFRAEK